MFSIFSWAGLGSSLRQSREYRARARRIALARRRDDQTTPLATDDHLIVATGDHLVANGEHLIASGQHLVVNDERVVATDDRQPLLDSSCHGEFLFSSLLNMYIFLLVLIQ